MKRKNFVIIGVTSVILSICLLLVYREISETRISISLLNSQNKAKIYLHEIVNLNMIAGYSNKNRDMILVDSAKIVNGHIVLKPEISEESKLYRLSFLNGFAHDKVVFFTLKKGNKLKIKCNKNNAFEYEIDGNENNKIIYNVMQKVGKMYSEVTPFWEEYQELYSLKMPQNILFKKKEAISKRLDIVYKNQSKYFIDFVNESFELNEFSGMIALDMIYYLPFSRSDFDRIRKLSEKLKNKTVKKYLHDKLTRKKESIIEHEKSMAMIGKLIPNIKLVSEKGVAFDIQNNLKKLTLIDFWASWCSPCVMSNNNVLIPLYDKYNKYGFEIIGISLDRNKDKWQFAINKNNYKWLHGVKDDKSINLNKLYNFSSIPYTILVDEKGKVIGINLEGEKLEEKIKEILKLNLK